jgi:integrase
MPVLIYLGAEHGASKQECLDLKWSDIDFDQGDKGKIFLFRTKNTQKRWGDLMPRTREALLAWRNHLLHARKRRRMNLILAGADLKTVKDMIGHKDISMTDRYTHLTQGYRNTVQEKLAQHYAAAKLRGT